MRRWNRRRTGKQGTDVQQYLEHQLIALVAGIEFLHAEGLLLRLGPIVLLAVSGFEILEDTFAGAHG